MLRAVKLLRKRRYRLGSPRRAIGRSVDAYVQRLLFDNIADVQRQQEYSIGGASYANGFPIAFGGDGGFRGNQRGINHGAEIVALRDYRIKELAENTSSFLRLFP